MLVWDGRSFLRAPGFFQAKALVVLVVDVAPIVVAGLWFNHT